MGCGSKLGAGSRKNEVVTQWFAFYVAYLQNIKILFRVENIIDGEHIGKLYSSYTIRNTHTHPYT